LASSPEFVDATDASVRTSRMDDRELVLRFLAFHLKSPEGYRQPDMDAFLLEAMARLNELDTRDLAEAERAFFEAMEAARGIFGGDAFRKRTSPAAGRRPVNKALFEAVAVGLAGLSQDGRRRLVERRDAVRSDFMALCADRDFEASVTQGTGDVTKVRRRFKEVSRLFGELVEQ
jgi:hypothetical protein